MTNPSLEASNETPDIQAARQLGHRLAAVVNQYAREGGLTDFHDCSADGPTLFIERDFSLEGFVAMCRRVVQEADEGRGLAVRGLTFANIGALAKVRIGT